MEDLGSLKHQFSVVALFLTLGCYCVFSILIGLDIWRAIRKRATWLPGKAFSLTGVTVQIIIWWTSVSNLTTNLIHGQEEDTSVYWLAFFYQDAVNARVALCVFIGYLLPTMTGPSVRTFLALGIRICIEIVCEVIDFQKKREQIPEKFSSWMIITNSILFVCIVLLGLISVCTSLGSQTVHGLVKKRTSAMISITNADKFQLLNERTLSISWNDFEDQVLSSWLVARVCRTDYVISRSVFSSAVGVVVTISVIICFFSHTYHNQIFNKFDPTEYIYVSPPPYILYSPLFCFIVIGLIVICWRWLNAQLYFRSHGHSWRRCLCLDDFWTRDTVDFIHMYDLKRNRQRFHDYEGCIDFSKRLPTKIFRLHQLVYLALMLQQSVVLFSKLCGLLSEVIIGKFMCRIRTHMRKQHPIALPEKYERILKLICMPGEHPSDLWDANEISFNKAKLLMQKGCEKGRQSEEISTIFRPHFLEWVEGGKELLNKLEKSALPLVSKHFPDVEKHCLSITAVSLITIFIRLHNTKSDRFGELLKACHEVWDLLSWADEYDKDFQANEEGLFPNFSNDKNQVGMAAEMELNRVKMEYHKLGPGCEEHVIDIQAARIILQDLLDKCKDLLSNENLVEGNEKKVAADLSDSKDWMEIAPKYYLYKLCRLMLEDDEIKDFVAWTKKALQNVIACSVSRLPDMIVKKCWKWAQEFEEDIIWEAIYLAGKCRGVMEAWADKSMHNQN